MTDLELTYKPWIDLGHAVVFQACMDYKGKIEHYRMVERNGGVYKMVTRHGSRTNTWYITLNSVKKEMRPLENFFNSDWCYLLSGVEGDALLRKLWEEA